MSILPFRKYDVGQYVRVTHDTSELIFALIREYDRREAIVIARRLAGSIYKIVDVDEMEVGGTSSIYYTVGDDFSGVYEIPERLLSNFN